MEAMTSRVLTQSTIGKGEKIMMISPETAITLLIIFAIASVLMRHIPRAIRMIRGISKRDTRISIIKEIEHTLMNCKGHWGNRGPTFLGLVSGLQESAKITADLHAIHRFLQKEVEKIPRKETLINLVGNLITFLPPEKIDAAALKWREIVESGAKNVESSSDQIARMIKIHD